MNILHWKYAVEIAKCGSINKAAEKLYMDPPNLSRAIKALEASMGITIFDRSAKGIRITSDGEVFIRHAEKIIQEIEAVESMFDKGSVGKRRFSVSVPRASYIADAFVNFSRQLPKDMRVSLYYKETNALRAIKNILDEGYKLGIIRYAAVYDRYYKAMLKDKGLQDEQIAQFQHVLTMHHTHPLAQRAQIDIDALKDYTEVAFADPFVPTLPLSEVKKTELPELSNHNIYVFDRASRFELLAENHQAFMWTAPIPDAYLQHYGLVQRSCGQEDRRYKDVLIYRKDYQLTALDQLFIAELQAAKQKNFSVGGEES